MPEHLGNRIRDFRLQRKMSLAELARVSGTSKSYIWGLENAHRQRPSADTLSRIAQALDTTIGQLVEAHDLEKTVLSEDQVFFRKYRLLDAEKKRIFRKLLDQFWDESPLNWATTLIKVHKASPIRRHFPVDVPHLILASTKQQYPEDPVSQIRSREIEGYQGSVVRPRKEDSEWSIAYSASITSPRIRRFTVAHMFGHYLLHRHRFPDGFRCNQHDLSVWHSTQDDKELEANTFAINLLLPMDEIQSRIAADTLPTSAVIKSLAARYGVPISVVLVRWVEYTTMPAVLVASRHHIVVSSKSNRSAVDAGVSISTTSLVPLEVPTESPASSVGPSEILVEQHPAGVWFDHPTFELVFDLEQQGVLSLLVLSDSEQGKTSEHLYK